jgi:hypothetical protein
MDERVAQTLSKISNFEMLDRFERNVIRQNANTKELAQSSRTLSRRRKFVTMRNPYEVGQEFATLFGSMERALKRSNYLRDRAAAEADWNKFARDLGPDFFEHVKRSRLAETLLSEPPRKLVKEGLKWEPEIAKPLANVTELFEQGVCRVRNNFLHGEKFVGGSGNWERDATLVYEALMVLREARDRIPAVAAELAKG